MIPLVFFGSPPFAAPTLLALARDGRFAIRLVVTQPDRPSGRGRRLTPPPVRVAADELGLPVWQPTTLRDPASIERLRGEAAQLFVVVAYGEIFRRTLLEMPPSGCLNVHPSLLPKYRGSSPIPAAILNGDAETGVSVIRLVRQLDAGPIVAQRRLPLSGDETSGQLSDRLATLAAEMLPDVIDGWIAGALTAEPQDEAQATYTRELRKDDGWIDWRRTAVTIERLVRAMTPWPGAWTTIGGKRLSISAVALTNEPSRPGSPGTLWGSSGGVYVLAGDAPIRLLRVRPEGKQEMTAEDWYRGARLPDDAAFDLRSLLETSG